MRWILNHLFLDLAINLQTEFTWEPVRNLIWLMNSLYIFSSLGIYHILWFSAVELDQKCNYQYLCILFQVLPWCSFCTTVGNKVWCATSSFSDITLIFPSFNGNAYLELPSLTSILRRDTDFNNKTGVEADVTLYLTIKTTSSSGTILYSEYLRCL